MPHTGHLCLPLWGRHADFQLTLTDCELVASHLTIIGLARWVVWRKTCPELMYGLKYIRCRQALSLSSAMHDSCAC